MIGYTVPEIRRLLVYLILRHAHPDEHTWSWSHWRRRDNTRPAPPTIEPAVTCHKCRCSTSPRTPRGPGMNGNTQPKACDIGLVGEEVVE